MPYPRRGDEPRSCAGDDGVPTTYDGVRNFCVISSRVNSNANRTWAMTQAEGEEHAKDLLRANQKQADGTTEFLVVEVVSRVRLAAPPIEVTKMRKD